VATTSNLDSRPVEIPVATMFLADWLVGWPVRLLSTLRLKLVLRWLGCPYGRSLMVDGRVVVQVRHRGSITIGNNVAIRSRFRSNLVGLTGPTVFQCIRDGRISIGDNTGCSSTVFSARSRIAVGRHVKIGGNVRIYDHDFHAVDHLARRDPQQDTAQCKSAPVVIGDDVFIGANSIILKGVTIGDRSIIGAGSVVSLKEIPPDSLVAGNPARVIKNLGAAAGSSQSEQH
jgi:acetyltransferase-like isoleucine patch superfamily enzyme